MELVSIEENKLFTKIHSNIFIKKDFISQKDYDALFLKAESLKEDEWNTHPTDERESGKISINLHETLSVSQEMIECIIPKYWINEHKTVNRMRALDTVHEFGWNPWAVADYLVVFYFGNFKGGNIKCYNLESPEEFTILEIETNTAYLLPVGNKEKYISELVEDGVKYSFIDWIYRHSEWALP
jgi:hypothetical protein